ncbi:RidA family protein [Nonomuraea sp. FMUSA5-5]|uniref:RidA family protein n=1 Tax=Nonomuraea composti TaxID=2720023 RepID=A0ABX1BGE0_9ACTN|nr:RidA family protein [Nonomuraea sp. FMUSA5-5]NJP94804.1 RidA family protein [Nonomuraea sp. FMUSA5-5]
MNEIVKAVVPHLAGTAIRHAPAVKAGPWVFVTGQEAIDPATGATGGNAPKIGESRRRREGEAVIAELRRLLGEMGTDWSRSVRVDQFYTSPDAVNPYHRARRHAVGDHLPASTSVVVDRCLAATSSVSAGLIAAHPDAGHDVAAVHPPGTEAGGHGVPPAVTCGEFVFVSGHMASQSGERLDPRAAVPPDMRWGASAIRRQTEHLIAHQLTPLLEAAGSSWETVVKAQVFLGDGDDLPEFLEVWSEHLNGIPCALTVVPAAAFRIAQGRIEMNLVALRNEAAGRKTVVEAGLPHGAALGPCVRAGDLLLPSGLMAVRADGAVAGAGISPTLDGLAHAGHLQAATIYDHADALCAAAGTSMAGAVRAQYFVTAVHDFPGVTAAWAARYGDEPHPFWCLQVPRPLPALGAALVADFWIYAPER